jgi:hypothetical protein
MLNVGHKKHAQPTELTSFDPGQFCEITARDYLRVLGDKQVCVSCSGYER